MTPFGFGLIIDAYNTKEKNAHILRRWEIWHMAALTRVKKMPPLKQFIGLLKSEPERGINEAAIIERLKAYQNGKSRQPKR